MIETNKIYQCDVLEGLKQLPDNSIDVIITSPPYNKMGLSGKMNTPNWLKSNIKYGSSYIWRKTIDYNDDANVDNMPEDKYQQWQIEILNECYRVLKDDGSMFYNHKNRIVRAQGKISTPYEWLLKTKFNIRQEIIWDRKSSPNVHNSRYLPTTEKIFWLTKTVRPSFIRNKDIEWKGEVWQIPFETNTEHPAPFPVALPDNILKCIPNPDGDKVVLDVFMGSGTTAIAAIKNGWKYIGFELFHEYVEMSEKRIIDYMHDKYL